MSERALHRRFPSLSGVPHLDLACVPTPVSRLDLSGVVPSFGGTAWVKHEDRSAAELGGNKVRKLEWLLGRSLARRRRTLVTSGGIGSNHALAAALYGGDAGMDVELVVFPHHVSPTSRRTLRAMCALGPRVTFCPRDELVPAFMAATSARLAADRHRPAVVLPGGSQPTGTLGATDLGLELVEQVKAGELDEPDAVFVPYGSGGTAAGLALAFGIAGLRTVVAAVRVYPLPLTSKAWLWGLGTTTARRLTQATGLRVSFDASLIRIAPGYIGGGYAEPTAVASAARDVAVGLGLDLEPTYSAKTFAAFLDAAASRRWRDRNIVFLNTYDPRIPEGLDTAPDDVVPPRLRRYL